MWLRIISYKKYIKPELLASLLAEVWDEKIFTRDEIVDGKTIFFDRVHTILTNREKRVIVSSALRPGFRFGIMPALDSSVTLSLFCRSRWAE